MIKKLQIFISSTFKDLIDERQAAVEAILNSGHIPAGMELFKASNESQLETIKRWIDDSDVYLLILGGRYGSIEPKSQKSYTQIEYEYAIKKKIPLFSVVINDDYLNEKVKKFGKDVLETDNPDKYKEFKKMVLSKSSRFFEDNKDIKICIHETINDFQSRLKFSGWVSGKAVEKNDKIEKENQKLLKENIELKEKYLKLKNKTNIDTFSNGLDYEEIKNTLVKKTIKIPKGRFGTTQERTIDLFSIFIRIRNQLVTGVDNRHGTSDDEAFIYYHICPSFLTLGLLDKTKISNKTTAEKFQLSKDGNKFLLLYDREKN